MAQSVAVFLVLAIALFAAAAQAQNSCVVRTSQAVTGSWSDSAYTYQQYSLTVTNTGSKVVTAAQIQLALASGASISQYWSLDAKNGATNTFTLPNWGGIQAGSSQSAGYVIRSASGTSAPVVLVETLTCPPNGDDDDQGDSGNFCADSVRDPTQVDSTTWQHEKEVFLTAYNLFAQRAANLDLTNTTVLDDLGYWLRDYTATIDVGGINRPTGFTLTRSTGLIITNAVSNPPTNNVGIENHNTRYEFMKAHLCRDRGLPIIYDQYWNDRLQKQSRFYAKAIKVGLLNNWHTFRINYNAYVKP